MIKLCKKCNIEKSVDLFSKNKSTNDGFSYSCNLCFKEYLLKRYKVRVNKMKQYLGEVCTLCGSDSQLQIDHIDPQTKSFDLLKRWGTNWNIITSELDKCQLLCRDCHVEKTKSDGSGRQLSTYARGDKINTSKFSQMDIDSIREKYKPFVYSYSMLAKEYGVSRSSIVHVVKNRTWHDPDYHPL